MSEEKILTKHPLGKSGRSVSKEKYEIVKQALLQALKKKELTHTRINKSAQ